MAKDIAVIQAAHSDLRDAHFLKRSKCRKDCLPRLVHPEPARRLQVAMCVCAYVCVCMCVHVCVREKMLHDTLTNNQVLKKKKTQIYKHKKYSNIHTNQTKNLQIGAFHDTRLNKDVGELLVDHFETGRALEIRINDHYLYIYVYIYMYEYTHVCVSPVCIYIYIHFCSVTLSLVEPLR